MVKQNAMKAKGAGGETPRILNLDNRWRWEVSFTFRPPYLWYYSGEWHGRSQSRYERSSEEHLPGIETQSFCL
jgi:hypothetical protein